MVFAQAAWLQAECDCWKAQSTESFELRAWINIRWAQHRDRDWGGHRLHIYNTLSTCSRCCTNLSPPRPQMLTRVESVSLEEELSKVSLRKWEQLRTLQMYFSRCGGSTEESAARWLEETKKKCMHTMWMYVCGREHNRHHEADTCICLSSAGGFWAFTSQSIPPALITCRSASSHHLTCFVTPSHAL